MAKRRKGKFPNLNAGQNLKSRTDYIEPDYVNGVKNQHGEEVIRPLTEEVTAWLDKFYGETVATSDKQLNPTDEIMGYMKQKAECRKEVAKLKKEHKQNKRKIKEDTRIQFLEAKIISIENCLDFLREEQGVFYPTCEEQRGLYNENNSRNFCLYNNRKSRGMLLELTTETVDTFTETYWNVLSSFGYDAEDALIEIVEERMRAQGLLKDSDSENLSDTSSDTDDSGDEE